MACPEPVFDLSFKVASTVKKSGHDCAATVVVWHLHVSCSHAGFAI